MKRAPLGTPAVTITGTPFSHIKVVSQHSLEEPATVEAAPPAMFQKQSYSQESEQVMAAPPPYHASNLTASLANNASGTTFAAKARAAELNAVRSQKAVNEMDTENEVPSAGSIALGAIKFTKPRNRGKIWKPLGLNGLLEESVHSDETSSESTISTTQSNSQLLQDTEPHTNGVAKCKLIRSESTETRLSHRSGSTSIASSQGLQDAANSHGLEIGANLNEVTAGGEKKSLSVSDKEQLSLAEDCTLNPQAASEGSSALIHGHRLSVMAESGVPPKAQAGIVSSEHSLPNEGNSKLQQTLTDMQETRLMKLGVLPALRTADINAQNSHDDPFVELPFTLQISSCDPLELEKQLSHYKNGLIPLSASAGIFTNERRPPVFPQFSPGQFSLQSVSKASTDCENLASLTIQRNGQPRDAKPYTSFAADKKELLLKNLNDVVASSMIQGSFPTETRTVLYDPAAREPTKKTPDPLAGESFGNLQGEGGDPHASAAGKESLKTSDPLPWTNRPVKIHDPAPPLSPTAQLSLLAKSLSTRTPSTISIDGSIEDAKQTPFSGLGLGLGLTLDHPQGIPITLDQTLVENAATVKLQDSMSGDVDDSQRSKGKMEGCIGPSGSMAATEPISQLMEAAYHNLSSYLNKSDQDYFGRYARVPEWCIDKSPRGDQSFFGDWGAWGPPPPRVGRDPRYRPTFHEGRYTVFEEIGRRGGREGLIRRYH